MEQLWCVTKIDNVLTLTCKCYTLILAPQVRVFYCPNKGSK